MNHFHEKFRQNDVKFAQRDWHQNMASIFLPLEEIEAKF